MRVSSVYFQISTILAAQAKISHILDNIVNVVKIISNASNNIAMCIYEIIESALIYSEIVDVSNNSCIEYEQINSNKAKSEKYDC